MPSHCHNLPYSRFAVALAGAAGKWAALPGLGCLTLSPALHWFAFIGNDNKEYIRYSVSIEK